MPSFHDFRFLSTDGKHKVFARECTPDGEVRAVLQIAHGVAEHVYRYAPFMEFLADNGFVVVANDHLGHGKTAENEQELCFFAEKDGWNDVVSDMDQLHKLTAAKYPDVPYFLFGHSMGSFLTRTYIIDHPEGLKGVIISGTGQNPAAVVAAGKLVAKLEMIDNGPMYHSPTLDKLAFGSYNKKYDHVRTKLDWLTRDEAIVDQYIADPLCGADGIIIKGAVRLQIRLPVGHAIFLEGAFRLANADHFLKRVIRTSNGRQQFIPGQQVCRKRHRQGVCAAGDLRADERRLGVEGVGIDAL